MNNKNLITKTKLIILSFLISLSLIPLSVDTVIAADSDIIITEIMYNPEGSDSDFEWIEIINTGLNPVTIIGGNTDSSWRIVDGSSNRTLSDTAFQGDMTINSDEIIVIAKNPIQFMTRYPSYIGDLLESSAMSLGNTEDTLGLKIGTTGIIWNEVNYFETWGGSNGKSLEKIDIYGLNEEANWTSSNEIHGTPGKVFIPNELPIAEAGNNQIGEVQQELIFDGSASYDNDGTITNYHWSFGDGNDTNTTESTTTHSYQQKGIYTVILTVTDNDSATDSDTIKVTVNPIVYSDKIILSEFLPSPGQETDWDSNGSANYEDEWIELYNQGSEDVDLANWVLDDVEGGSSPFVIPENTVIKGKGYFLLFRNLTGIALNNDIDSVRFFNPDKELLEEVSYDDINTDQVYAKDSDGNWQLSTTPSPNENNQITSEEEYKKNREQTNKDTKSQQPKLQTINKIRKMGKQGNVLIIGTITATPEILGTDTIYIQDATSGLKVKLNNSNYDFLKLGDQIKISGEVSKAYNETYLKMSDDSFFKVLKHLKTPTGIKVNTGNINETMEGKLVFVNAIVSATSGNTFYLNDGSGEIKVYIKDSTEINKPKMRTGYYALVQGIVSQYNDEYRVLPRYQSDIFVSTQPITEGTILGVTKLPDTGNVNFLFGTLVIMIGVGIRGKFRLS